jgi:hypothetical protein
MWIIFSYPINTFDECHNGNTASLFADVNMKLYDYVGDDKRPFVLVFISFTASLVLV